MKLVPFFSDEIVINVHSATEREHIGQNIAIKDFAAGEKVALYQMDNGDLKAFRGERQYPVRPFIEGKEASVDTP